MKKYILPYKKGNPGMVVVWGSSEAHSYPADPELRVEGRISSGPVVPFGRLAKRI